MEKNSVRLCLTLPFLRGPGPDSQGAQDDIRNFWPRVRRLWPGLPTDSGPVLPGRDSAPSFSPEVWFCPASWPFSAQEAAACLRELRALDATALASIPVGQLRRDNARRSEQLTEQDALAAWGSMPHAPEAEASRHSRDAARQHQALLEARQAQKLLLWLWLQEERCAELAGLSASFSRRALDLGQLLGPDPDGSQNGAPASEEQDALFSDPLRREALSQSGGLPDLSSPLRLDSSLLPPWQLVLVNALPFLPEDAVLVPEGDMRTELLEELDFQPLPPEQQHWAERLGCEPSALRHVLWAEAPVRPLLGRFAPGSARSPRQDSTAEDSLRRPRLWLIRKDDTV